MKKVWSFDTDETNYVSEVNTLFKKYQEGLNKSQDFLKARLDWSIDEMANAILTLSVSSQSIPQRDIFTANIRCDGLVDLAVHYYTTNKFHRSLTIKQLEQLLDEVVKSKEMGSVISYFIKVTQQVNE